MEKGTDSLLSCFLGTYANLGNRQAENKDFGQGEALGVQETT